jgi:DNA invertase Pin-like site-specific DNA recombinase
MRVATYLRCSTLEQHVENQRLELTRYVTARGWEVFKEYADEGISGSKDRRPALDALLADAKRRRFDAVVVWKLDRLGRNLRHLLFLMEELQALGVGLVSLGESIDTTTPAGRLQIHVLSAVAQFERDRLRERVVAGLQRVRAQGKRLGRPKAEVPVARLRGVADLPVDAAAAALGVSRSTLKRWRRQVRSVDAPRDNRLLSPHRTERSRR